MAFNLTFTQYNELNALWLDLADPGSSGLYDPYNRDGYAELYEKIISYIDAYDISNTLTQDEQRSALWIKGALGVNQNNTAQSDFIRDYNNAQAALRYGIGVTDAQMDKISDEVAFRVTRSILDSYPAGGIPPIDVIAADDAAPAAINLFNNDTSPGGWAGNPLFLFLAHDDAFENNIIHEDDDTYDALAMLKVADDVAGGFLSFFDGTVRDLIVDAGSTGWSAGAISTILGAYNTLDAYLLNAYGEDLLKVGYETFFGDLELGSEGDDSAVGGSSFS